MKNSVRAFKILEESGFTKENAEAFLVCIENDDTQLATKGDLKDLEIKILRELGTIRGDISGVYKSISDFTWKFIGSLIAVLTIFKGLDIFLGHIK